MPNGSEKGSSKLRLGLGLLAVLMWPADVWAAPPAEGTSPAAGSETEPASAPEGGAPDTATEAPPPDPGIPVAEAAPGEPGPAETAPAEPGPAETAPAETAPADPVPAEPGPAEPAPPEDVDVSLLEGEGDAQPAASAAVVPESAPAEGEKKLDKHDPKNYSHKHHGFVGVGSGVGYGLLTAGDKFCGEFSSDQTDADRRKSLCTGLIPPYLDFTLGFGAAKRIDIVVAVRVNLLKREYRGHTCHPSLDPAVCSGGRGLFINGRGVGVLPGIRIWSAKVQNMVKFGGAVDILYMYENMNGYRNRPRLQPEGDSKGAGEDNENLDAESDVSDHILGMRGGPVIQIDPHHNVGIYILPAVQMSFRPQKAGADEGGWFEAGFEGSIGLQARFP